MNTRYDSPNLLWWQSVQIWLHFIGTGTLSCKLAHVLRHDAKILMIHDIDIAMSQNKMKNKHLSVHDIWKFHYMWDKKRYSVSRQTKNILVSCVMTWYKHTHVLKYDTNNEHTRVKTWYWSTHMCNNTSMTIFSGWISFCIQ